MKKIYVNPDTFECHTTNQDGTFLEIETKHFDGKCDTFIEGYRFIPYGKSWTSSDGIVFHGEMVAPWKDYNELEAAQREYEMQILGNYQEAFAILEG